MQKPIIGKRESHSDNARFGRILWLTVAVIFLALLAVVIWTWAHGSAVWDRRPSRPGIGATPLLLETGEDVGDGVATVAPIDAEADGTGGLPLSILCPTGTASPSESDTSLPDGELIYHGRRNDRMEIALSFDDGPHPRYTPIILDILAEYGIRATFFMVGENVGYYPAAAEAVVAAGHEIGNHTFSHRKFNLMSEHEMLAEIAACENAIASVSEQKPHFIRPPEGNLNDTMRRVIGSLDYRIVLWDVDTRDWAHTPPDQICTHILDTVQAGDIILMHDFIGHDSPTPEALRRVIPALLERGYHFVTVGELVDGSD